MLVYAFMYPPTGDLMSDFAKNCNFMPEMPSNSAFVLIRFPKFFFEIYQVRCLCMIIRLLSMPIPLFYVEICAKILIFMPEMLSIDSCSNPFNSELDPLLSLLM
jgi:hypothetical protein